MPNFLNATCPVCGQPKWLTHCTRGKCNFGPPPEPDEPPPDYDATPAPQEER